MDRLYYEKGKANTVTFSNIVVPDEFNGIPFKATPVYDVWFRLRGDGKPNYFALKLPTERKLKDYLEIDSEGDFDGDGHKFQYWDTTNNVKVGTDCKDIDPEMNPDKPEKCFDYKDNDCDGNVDENDGLHGNISCDQEQNKYTCEGTEGYEFIPFQRTAYDGTIYKVDKGKFLEGAGCCGNNNDDIGKVVTPTSGPKAGKKMLCFSDGTNKYWKDASEPPNPFEIERSPNLTYDVISDSLNWFGCAQSGQILPGGINTLNAYQVLTYSGLEAVEPIALGEAFGQYDSGTNDITLLPADQWDSGLSIFTATGGGTPPHCKNGVLDADESDVDCGGSCDPCFDGKNCISNDDCKSGNCKLETKKCEPKTVPVNLLQKSYMARRFICSPRNAENIFTECAGFNLGAAKNINLRDRIRRAGNPLSSIFEFVKSADNVNYAIVFGLPTSIQGTYYVMPFYVERDADNKITNWTQYDNLEFDIAYAKDINNYKIAIFNKYDRPWETKFETSLGITGIKVFDEPIKNYIVNQPQEGKWLHVKIPLTFTRDRITFIALYVNKSDVPSNIIITHPNLTGQYRNIIAIDRISLTKNNPSENKYCAAFPTNDVGDYWIGGEQIDNNTNVDVMLDPVGKLICDQTPSWGWTGTRCCGDDGEENYTDTKAGCLRGSIVRNNSVFNFTQNADGTGQVTSVLYIAGEDKPFKTCGSAKAGFPPAEINNEIESKDNTACISIGAWYCDFDSFWKDKYKIAGEIIDTSRTLPDEVKTDAPDSAVKGCCPQNYCWSGPEFIVGVPANETGSKGCVPDQSTSFALGDEFFFNSSLKYGRYVSGTTTNYITGNNVAYRCIKGTWRVAIPKWNPEHTKQGYCERFDQCFLNESVGCVDAGYWKGEKYCEVKPQTITIGTVTLSNIDFANWTTRTKLVAYELFKIANSNSASRANFTIYCDSYDKVLNEFNYTQD